MGRKWNDSQVSLATNRYRYNGKEEQTTAAGMPYTDYDARLFDPEHYTWLSPDPLSGKYPGVYPYAFCAGDPVNRIDEYGMRDTLFNAAVDQGITKIPNTETPIIIDGKPNIEAYNCHSFAWEESKGDVNDVRNKDLVDVGITKWDNNPDNNLKGFEQIDKNVPNQPGDRVIYYVDTNKNGVYDGGETIVHSAVVYSVDGNGYTKLVISKMGESWISINHPRAPLFYAHSDGYVTGPKTSRAYFRHVGSDSAPEVVLPKNTSILQF